MSSWLKRGVEIALAGVLLGLVTFGILQLRSADTPPSEELVAPSVTQNQVPDLPEQATFGRTVRARRPAAESEPPSLEPTEAPTATAVTRAEVMEPTTALPSSPARAPNSAEEGLTADKALARWRELSESGQGSGSAAEGAAQLDQLMKEIVGSVAASGPNGTQTALQLSARDQEQAVREFIEIQRLPPESQAARMKNLAQRMGISVPPLPDLDAGQTQ